MEVPLIVVVLQEVPLRDDTILYPGTTRSGFTRPSKVGPRELNAARPDPL